MGSTDGDEIYEYDTVLRWVVDVLEEKIYGKEVCGKLY
jgi:hypothetical protein